ncbi:MULTISPECIES: hypothetical protein [unclassified Colwellia]|uniref:hypothetical protein n=1 Tax=unclassified Colwellia TaxID=196834 RepID=UPI0015F71DC0|nr:MULTISPECIES: hypothetical protein [unclassified Colwellia]MBA6234004.1 hypothetical protein [Colwellia sp. MB02u-7]MBA6236932.1 hypothetical protein [Colwellia sp. MB02u-11]MBA6256125.1 hypothetical protein [Colwellia sp. MB3u-28]MBA6259356.1 hypothetical protein [Colwellia sp. MB3u-41]MBA6300678.1 hypothetical protein [Colwellia sp. MB3u-22]
MNTGQHTGFNAVIAKVSQKERSHFHKMVIRIGNFLIALILGLVTLILIDVYKMLTNKTTL